MSTRCARRGYLYLTRPPKTTTMTSWTTVLTLSVLTGTCLSSSLLRNETDSVFGSDVVILPLAFGDFNSDKLTDLIVIDAKDR